MALIAGVRYRARAGARRVWDRAAWIGRPILSAEEGNALIGRLIESGGAAAIAKIGSAELQAVRRHLGRLGRPRGPEVWRDAAELRRDLHLVAGVYPDEPEVFSRFARVYLEVLPELDVIAVWFKPGEAQLVRRRVDRATAVDLAALNSYFHSRPWTRTLEGKRVLVVSPFAASIEAQYTRRAEVWPEHPDVLPSLMLETLRVPLTAGLVPPTYTDWFAALDDFRTKMSETEFDVALVGAGAWSMPLTVYAKQLGRIGVHLGGGTQVLFGIRGARWDRDPDVSRYYTDAWIRPSGDERPSGYEQVDRASYW